MLSALFTISFTLTGIILLFLSRDGQDTAGIQTHKRKATLFLAGCLLVIIAAFMCILKWVMV
jgi:hypothetical protein